MKVYVVVLETENCVSVCNVYRDHIAAKEYVRKAYKTTYQDYKDRGYNLREFFEVDVPDEYGATIYISPSDFFIWRIEGCDVINSGGDSCADD